MQKFPQRTLVLMILALIAFGFFFTNLHRRAAKPEPARTRVQPVIMITPVGGDQ